MIRMKDHIFGVSVERIWFERANSSCSLSRFMRMDSPGKDVWHRCSERSYTVISDLTLSEEELLKCMRKKVRYEVTRAEKEGITYQAFSSQDVRKQKQILDRFENAYLKFAADLGNQAVTDAYNRKKIDAYLSHDCFLLTIAKKDAVSVYHAYVYDEHEAVLIYSVSDFREEHVDKNLAGRCNKWLHYEDMLYLKKMGLSTYDWGNISSKEAPNGIDNFKISFGGRIAETYNILEGNNWIGKILTAGYKWKRRKRT